MMLAPDQAAWLLIAAAPLGFYVAWSDMRAMRIPNGSVLLLAAGFLVIGLWALPFDMYLRQLLHLPVVLVVGFLLSTFRLIGAGDAKFAAAMAPYLARGDLIFVMFLFASVLMGAFVTHRLARGIPAARRAAPDWESWTRRKDFPMGLALAGTLVFYLLLAALLGR